MMNYSTMEVLKHEDIIDDLTIKYEPFLSDDDFTGDQDTCDMLDGVKVEQRPCDNHYPSERKYFLPIEAMKLMSEIMSDKEDVAEVLKVVTRKYELLSQKFESLKETLLQQEDASNCSSTIALPSEDPNGCKTDNNSTKQFEASSSSPATLSPAAVGSDEMASEATLAMSISNSITTVTTPTDLSTEVAPIFPLDETTLNNNLPTNKELQGRTPNLLKDTVPLPLSSQPVHFHNHGSDCGTDPPQLESNADNIVSRIDFSKEPVIVLTHCMNAEKSKAEVTDQSATGSGASPAEGMRKRPKNEGHQKLQNVAECPKKPLKFRGRKMKRAANPKQFLEDKSSEKSEDDSTEDSKFHCSICNKFFTTKYYLNKHSQIHSGRFSFICHYCGKGFRNITDLVRHIRIHTGEKPFRCSECGERFNQKGDLKKHLLIHTGEKPHQCLVCKKRFSQSSNLIHHNNSIHLKIKSFKCSFCDRPFSHKGHLKSHERIHTGEKPFECKICLKRFADRRNMESHQRIHK